MAEAAGSNTTVLEETPIASPIETAEELLPAARVDATRPDATTSLWRNGDFMRFWVGETLSLYGTQVTVLALPLTAVFVFDAGAGQLGLLRFLQLMPYLAFSLLFGVWVDRVRRRPVMISANFARMVLLALVPTLMILGRLTPASLLAIAFFVGVASVLFDVSWMSYVPSLVTKRHLVEANSKLAISASSADVAGPGVAGFIINLVTAPVAIAMDAASYFISIVLFLFIRSPESRPAPSPSRGRLRKELAEGLRWVFGDRNLRAMAGVGFCCNFILMFTSSLFILYAIRDRNLSSSTFGFVLSMGAVGGLLGSSIASPIVRRFRLGRVYSVAMAAVFLGPMLIPLAAGPKGVVVTMFIASFFISYVGLSVANVVIVSLRQCITPPSLMGRMSAAMRTMLFGGGAVGSLMSGLLGSAVGLRAALALGALGSAALVVPVVFSPVARLIQLPTPTDAVGDPQ